MQLNKLKQLKLLRISRFLWHSARKRGGLMLPRARTGKLDWISTEMGPETIHFPNSRQAPITHYTFKQTVEIFDRYFPLLLLHMETHGQLFVLQIRNSLYLMNSNN